MIDGRHCSDVVDVKSCRGPNVDSNHYLEKTVVRARVSTQHNIQKPVEKWDVEKFENEGIKQQFAEKLEEKIISGMVNEQLDINETWNQIRRNVESTAAETIGKRTGRGRNHWFDIECQQALDAKNTARLKNLGRSTRAGVDEYRSKRDFARKLFRKKKRQQQREVLVEIERFRSQNQSRKLYRNVNEIRNGYSQQPLLCRDKSGLVLADEEKCIKR